MGKRERKEAQIEIYKSVFGALLNFVVITMGGGLLIYVLESKPLSGGAVIFVPALDVIFIFSMWFLRKKWLKLAEEI